MWKSKQVEKDSLNRFVCVSILANKQSMSQHRRQPIHHILTVDKFQRCYRPAQHWKYQRYKHAPSEGLKFSCHCSMILIWDLYHGNSQGARNMHRSITLHVNTVAVLTARRNEVNRSCKQYILVTSYVGLHVWREESNRKQTVFCGLSAWDVCWFRSWSDFDNSGA